MPETHASLTLVSRGIQRLLPLEVGISEAIQQPNDSTTIKGYQGIWDTGATGSVITKKVADQLKIFSIGLVDVNTASGAERSNSYLINMYLPNKVVIPGIRVTEGKLMGGFEVLIGMDVISLGDFVINNFDGHTSYSFRIPSLEFVDYTKKPAPIRQQRKEMKRQQAKRLPKIPPTKA